MTCSCGCGQSITGRDEAGRERSYAPGHYVNETPWRCKRCNLRSKSMFSPFPRPQDSLCRRCRVLTMEGI